MIWDSIEGNWKELKGKVREQWGALNNDHLDQIAGKRDQSSDKIQDFYGISKEAADTQIDAFAERNKDHETG